MTHEPLAAFHRRPWRLLALLLLLLAATLVPATPLHAEDEEAKPDPAKGFLDHQLPPKAPTPPDDPQAADRVLSRSGAADGVHDWHGAYIRAPDGTLSTVGQATLKLASDKEYGRTQAIHDLKHGGERMQPLVRGFDVGRHEILKHLYHRAMIVANAELETQGLSLCQKVQAVNAGGTGDYTRDQDITVFAGDEIREKAFFDAIEKVARDELKLTVDVKSTGGVDFPEIEVTFFPGRNDLPDARFATDVEDFALKYQHAIAKQAADAEAYKGGGADIEVKGRRVPGKMYVQQLTWENGKPVYIAETPQNFREGRSLFSGTAPERWQRFEMAAHIFSDFVQGRQHASGGDHDLTKGPLKYAGRGIEYFCEIHGMKPWPKLLPSDRYALLRRIWPQFDPKTEKGLRILKQFEQAIDIAVHVKGKKTLPSGVDPTTMGGAERMALRFLHNATAATVSQMARDMLYPPAFDTKFMRAIAGDSWDAMTPAERFAFAQKRDKTFRAATSRAAMENLLVAVSLLRNMDYQDGKLASRRAGQRAIHRLLSEAGPDMRPVVELASEYADVWARKQQTADPAIRAECDAQLAAVRQKLVKHCPLAPTEMPSLEILRKAAAEGPRAVLDAETRPGRSWFTPEMQDVKQAFQEHFKQAFPGHAQQWRNFQAHIAEHGKLDYVGKRMYDEVAQWDTLADLLTLIELYQNDAGFWDYGTFIGINVGSRLHWAVGPMIQAFMVYDKEPQLALKKFKELGKSVVFLTLARVVPWAGAVKIGFDVMRGTVVVTVGWAIGQANKQTVDALYTGLAGRTDAAAEGTWRGRLRDSGICVLPAHHVLRRTHPKTGALVIGIDRARLYRDFFQAWTGAEADAVPRSMPPRPGAAKFVMAHDMFVRVLLQQAEQYGPLWIPSAEKPWAPMRLTEKEATDAMGELHPHLYRHAAKLADDVLHKTAARSYRSYMEEEGTDVIREALVRRFASDLLGGLLEHWQVRITAQLLAARDIERTAVFTDWRVIADSLHKKYVPTPESRPPLQMRLEGNRWRATRGPNWTFFQPPDEGPGLQFHLEARADGVPVLDGAALDGSQPVRVSASLHGTGEMSEAEGPIKFEITTRKLKKVRKIGEGDADGPLEPGDVVEDVILVRALAADGAGPELVRTEIPLRVLLPEAGGARKIPLYEHTAYFRDGRLRERYVYFKRFDGMPADWVQEYGQVLHGPYERFHGEDVVGGLEMYEYGRLHGLRKDFNLKGDLVRQVPYVRGEPDGQEVRFDPDSVARLEITHAGGQIVAKNGTGTTGAPYIHLTYAYTEVPDGTPKMSGEARRWWSNGQPRWRGRYADARLDLNGIGGENAEQIYGKVGVWEFFYDNGQLQERSTYRDGVLDGPTETFDEEGKPVHVGTLVPAARGSISDGLWEHYDPPGTLETRTTWRAGEEVSVKDGPHVEYYASGGVARRGPYRNDLQTGLWESFSEEGVLLESARYDQGKLHGTRRTFFSSGEPESTEAYRKGELHGPRREWSFTRDGSKHYLKFEQTYDDGGYDHVEYHPSGAVADRARYVRIVLEDGTVTHQVDGLRRRFYATGEPMDETTYVRGKGHGPFRGFDEKGRQTVEGSFEDGEKDGRWIYTDHFPGGGGAQRSEMYKHGKRVDPGG